MTGRPTRSGDTRYIAASPGLAASCRRPLVSNVGHHTAVTRASDAASLCFRKSTFLRRTRPLTARVEAAFRSVDSLRWVARPRGEDPGTSSQVAPVHPTSAEGSIRTSSIRNTRVP